MKIRHLGILFAAAFGLVVTPVFALGIYKWTDEAGVVHYSEKAPESDEQAVEIMSLNADDGNGLGISEEDDPEGYAAHREEMDELWADIEEKKERARERREREESRQVIYVQPEQQYNYGNPWFGYRPPHRPIRPPERPVQLPEPASPPSSVLDPGVFRR